MQCHPKNLNNEHQIYRYLCLFSWVATMWAVFSDRAIHITAGVKSLKRKGNRKEDQEDLFTLLG